MAEGTVYYKNSPALESVQGEVSASFSDDLLRGARSLEEQHAVGTAADALQPGRSLWKRLLSMVWGEMDNNHICSQVDQVVSVILQSGLLNKEHQHLVATVMRASKESELDDKGTSSGRSPEAPPPSLADELEGFHTADSGIEQPMDASEPAPSLQCQVPQSSLVDSSRTVLLLSSAVVVVLPLLWWSPCMLLTFTLLLAVSAVTLLCAHVWRYTRRRAAERGVAQVVRYVEGFDSLLCLVAESIRYLQEMEALSKGYARSSVIGAHVHQVGGAGMGVSHCVVLRRVFHQVVRGISDGVHACVLSDGTSLLEPAPDIANGLGLLAGEDGLGLAELKEQCHTLAVGNSTVLRDLCLELVGSPFKGVPGRPTDPIPLLCTLSTSLQRLTLAVEGGSRRLKWALKFEDIYCSEPEGCVKGLLRGAGRGPSSAPLAQSLLRGLRGMDLKGQLVVRSVRDCVRLLNANSILEDSLHQVEAHLLAMQTHLSALGTDLTDALQMLQPQDSSTTEYSVGSDCPSDVEGVDSYQPKETASPDRSPPSSDEEKVYEAYVSRRHESEEEWPTGGEDPEYPRGRSDLPVKMVNELKNVLSLRELQRMERRAMRRRRTRGGCDRWTDREADEQAVGQTHTQTDRHTMQRTMANNSQLPPSSDSPVSNPPGAQEEATVPSHATSSPFPSGGVPPGDLLGDGPEVGVSTAPSMVTAKHTGEGLPQLQAVSSLVALLARQQKSPRKEECFGDSSGSEEVA